MNNTQNSEKTNRVGNQNVQPAYRSWNEGEADKTSWPTERCTCTMSFHLLK